MTGIISEMQQVVSVIVEDDEKASDVVYALIRQFGGDRFYLPGNDYDRRNKEIKSLYRQKTSINVLAKRYSLSARTIRRIVSSEK